jgi:uncharacterized protein YoxC
MEFWLSFLPIVIYLLLIVLITVGIVLGLKTILTMNKVDKVVDDVQNKVDSLNSLFGIIDFTTDKIASVTDKLVGAASNFVNKLFKKKKKKEEE